MSKLIYTRDILSLIAFKVLFVCMCVYALNNIHVHSRMKLVLILIFFFFFFQFFLFLFFILNKKGVLVVFICFKKVFVIGISSVDDLICMEIPGMLYMVFIKLFASYT